MTGWYFSGLLKAGWEESVLKRIPTWYVFNLLASSLWRCGGTEPLVLIKETAVRISIVKPMLLQDAECELRTRLYRWAKATMTREVAEDFPALRACQHNRRVKCFLLWAQSMSESKRLPRCLTLVQRSYERHLSEAERSPQAEALFMEYHNACGQFHDTIPPVPDSDRHAPGFVRADAQHGMECIIHELDPLCNKLKKLQKNERKFTSKRKKFRRVFGDWTLSIHVEIRPRDETVDAYGFLRRFDAQPKRFTDEWSSRFDPLMLLGVSGSHFPFVGQSHETLCAQSLRASFEMFVPFIPKLVEGLGVTP